MAREEAKGVSLRLSAASRRLAVAACAKVLYWAEHFVAKFSLTVI